MWRGLTRRWRQVSGAGLPPPCAAAVGYAEASSLVEGIQVHFLKLASRAVGNDVLSTFSAGASVKVSLTGYLASAIIKAG